MTIIVFDYPQAAMSCCWNGRRVRGIARIVGPDEEPGWLALDNGKRVHESEVAMRGTHPFDPDASGYGCAVCGFNEQAEIHERRRDA